VNPKPIDANPLNTGQTRISRTQESSKIYQIASIIENVKYTREMSELNQVNWQYSAILDGEFFSGNR
jgi:flagellin-like hook-associated protein FlgL